MIRILYIVLFVFSYQVLAAQDTSIRVMTYNIRLLHQGDGINYWDHRRPHLTNLIRYHEADIIGVQEAFRSQLDNITTDLPQYNWFGVCRTNGSLTPQPDNEFSAILYNRDRFQLLDGNTLWLSETPNKIGSVGWDAALPRIVTWAKFRDKINDEIFYHFNTHFDHIGETARYESALLILKKIKEIAGNAPVVLTGDFNCSQSERPYLALTDTTRSYYFKDAFATSTDLHYGPIATFAPDFLITGLTDRRIDFIFTRNNIAVRKHGILSDSMNGRLPSDHLPVLAEIIFIGN